MSQVESRELKKKEKKKTKRNRQLYKFVGLDVDFFVYHESEFQLNSFF